MLRQGHNEAFHEAAVDGIPISDKLTRFAGDNEMPTCAPPLDLDELTARRRPTARPAAIRSLRSTGA